MQVYINTEVRTKGNKHIHIQRYDSSLADFFKMSCQSRASFVKVLLRAAIHTSQTDAVVKTNGS